MDRELTRQFTSSAEKAFGGLTHLSGLTRRLIGRTWCRLCNPDHFNGFTLSTLRAMAAKAGFTLALVNCARPWVDDNFQALLVNDNAVPTNMRA